MENSIGIVIGIVIVGFVVYNFFLKSDSSASAPAPVKEAPAKAPVKEVKEEVVVKAPTKTQLTSKTKKEIDDLAKNEWGIKLDARETKDKMVAQFVKEAKAIAKK
jgi:plastocyanin domain-containing protein|tara:strand:+ start:1266 stop:1580 length:315 start_codon:yes stop_codon:yes gene_type:complete